MSDAKTLGTKLVALCKEGKNKVCVQELYADDVVSVESLGNEQMPREMKGKQAVLGKTDWFFANNEVHSSSVDGPFPHGDDKFAVLFDMDMTFKPTGERGKMREIGIYTVKGGKIAREEFYYQS